MKIDVKLHDRDDGDNWFRRFNYDFSGWSRDMIMGAVFWEFMDTSFDVVEITDRATDDKLFERGCGPE